MATDPLDQLRGLDTIVRARAAFVRELYERLRDELTPLLTHAGGTMVETRTTAVAPSLSYRDAHAAMTWLQEVLEFTVVARFDEPDGAVAHARLAWRDGTINVSTRREGGRMPATGPASIVLTAANAGEVDRLYQKALDAGARVVVPIEDTAYGNHGFSLQDPEGHLWNVGIEWLDSDAARRLPQRRI
jgi:uncharacterized glyoxalase superfamily protein PhnB